jgi:hypothetical protein
LLGAAAYVVLTKRGGGECSPEGKEEILTTCPDGTWKTKRVCVDGSWSSRTKDCVTEPITASIDVTVNVS